MKPHAALGPDGMTLYYQQLWGRDDKNVTFFALEILNGGGNPSNINYPKKKKPKVPGDFRPSSLCNIVYKIFTKINANRLKFRRIMSSPKSRKNHAFTKTLIKSH